MLYLMLLLLGLSYEATSKDIPLKNVEGCQLPVFPKNGSYVILHNDQITTPGDFTGRYTVLVYSCDTDFDLTAPSSVCTSDNTWSTAPECNERCSMVKSSTVNFDCLSPNGAITPCLAKLPSGSVVLSSCMEGHVALGRVLAELKCRNGKWIQNTPACDADADACVTDIGECTPPAALPQGSSQPSASIDENFHDVKIAELVAQNEILGNTLREYNASMTEQLNNIAGWQAGVLQIHQLQNARLLGVKTVLEKQGTTIFQLRRASEQLRVEQTQVIAEQKLENSKLRAEVESLKTALMQGAAKKAVPDKQKNKLELFKLRGWPRDHTPE